MIDAQCDADRVVEIFPRQLNDIVHQRCRHSHHHQYPETLLESACSLFTPRQDKIPLLAQADKLGWLEQRHQSDLCKNGLIF